MIYLVIYLVKPHRQTTQPGLGLSGLVHEKAHPVVPDIAQSRLKCIDAGCIHHPLVQQVPPINDLTWKKYLVISLVHWVLTSLHVWTLVPLLFVSKIKSLWSEILLNPLYILKTSIRSCLFLLKECHSTSPDSVLVSLFPAIFPPSPWLYLITMAFT